MTNIMDARGRLSSSDGMHYTSCCSYDIQGRISAETMLLNGKHPMSNLLPGATHSYGYLSQRRNAHRSYNQDTRWRSVTGTAGLPVRYEYGFEQARAGGPWRNYTKEIKLNFHGTDPSEWTKNYLDMAGPDPPIKLFLPRHMRLTIQPIFLQQPRSALETARPGQCG